MRRYSIALFAGLLSFLAVPLCASFGTAQELAPSQRDQPPDLSVHDIEELLDESIDVEPFRQEMMLKESLELLKKVLKAKNKSLPIVIDVNAFKEEDPDAPDTQDESVKIDSPLRTMKVRHVLRAVIGQIKTNNANFRVKPGFVSITTNSRSAPRALMSEQIAINFRGRPLHLAIDDLYEQTGVSVVLDPRVGMSARTPITARFREIAVGDALLLMSEMANLKMVTREDGNVIFITTPAHARQFIFERMMNPYGLPNWRNGIRSIRAEAAE